VASRNLKINTPRSLVKSATLNQQVAPTIIRALGQNPTELKAVVKTPHLAAGTGGSNGHSPMAPARAFWHRVWPVCALFFITDATWLPA
jgi:hypothetical protein